MHFFGGELRGAVRDVDDVRAFLDALAQNFPSMRFERAADVGAGIGRVAKGVLLPRYERVDLLEQSARLLAAAAWCGVWQLLLCGILNGGWGGKLGTAAALGVLTVRIWPDKL